MPLALLLLVALAGCTAADGESPRRPLPDTATDTAMDAAPAMHTPAFRAMTFDARRTPAPEALVELRDLGVTHLTLISFGFQPGYSVPEVRLHNDTRWFSESDAGIRALAEATDTLGLGLILKPHIWVGEYHTDGQQRHTVGFATEAEWAAWEADYRTLLLHYAHLAAEVDADLLVVGTELANVVRTREAFWRGLIAAIRAIYDGPLTYAANWWEEYEDVPFWDALDYIGIQAYFELTDAPDPDVRALKAGWEPAVATMQALSERTGRPILFTEIGYRNVPYAAAEPWRWPQRGEDARVAADDGLQARLYQAFFEQLWHRPWFAGAILWKWHPPDTSGRRRSRPLAFSPQDRPAEAVIGAWFTASAQ